MVCQLSLLLVYYIIYKDPSSGPSGISVRISCNKICYKGTHVAAGLSWLKKMDFLLRKADGQGARNEQSKGLSVLANRH